MQRDIQNGLEVWTDSFLPVVATARKGIAIDTQGFDAVMFSFDARDNSAAAVKHVLTSADSIPIVIEESDASGSGFAAIDAIKYLPTGDDLKMEPQLATGAVKTIGCTSTKRYVRISVDAVTLDSIASPNLLVVMTATLKKLSV